MAGWYTPRQLIKWVANKEGVAHLDLKPPTTLEAIQTAITVTGTVEGYTATDEFLLRHGIVQIAKWTVRGIEHVLAA